MAESLGGVVAVKGGGLQKRRHRRDGLTKAKRKLFLDRLAATCNVTDAARAAGVKKSNCYNLRRRDPQFAALWREAIATGYELLEAALLANALNDINDVDIEPDVTLDLVSEERRIGVAGPRVDPARRTVDPKVRVVSVKDALALLARQNSIQSGCAKGGVRRRLGPDEVATAINKKLDALARQLGKEF